MRVLLLSVVALTAAATPVLVAAQPAAAEAALAAVPQGSRLRVTMDPEGFARRGRSWVVTGDTLRWDPGTPAAGAVPLAAVRRVEVSRGRRGPAAIGALLGGLAGAAASAVGGAAAPADRRGRTLAVAGSVTAVGVGAGALVGAALGERWTRVYERP